MPFLGRASTIDSLPSDDVTTNSTLRRNISSGGLSDNLKDRADKQLLNVSRTSEYGRLEGSLARRAEMFGKIGKERENEERQWNMFKGRFANKVLARLYSRRAYTTGLIFSRGSFLCDVSKLMSGSVKNDIDDYSNFPSEGVVHTSAMVAGDSGCVVVPIPKDRLVSFLDDNPGVLLSLLGTHVIL